jgi:hypothetical protein
MRIGNCGLGMKNALPFFDLDIEGISDRTAPPAIAVQNCPHEWDRCVPLSAADFPAVVGAKGICTKPLRGRLTPAFRVV